jgi:hypothetical protein
MPRPSVAPAAILTVTKCTQLLLVCPERSFPPLLSNFSPDSGTLKPGA